MAIIAIIWLSGFRAAHTSKVKTYDVKWRIYWQYMEGCIGCIMASIATFRKLFLTSISNAAAKAKKNRQGPSYSFRQRLESKLKLSRGAKDPWRDVSGDDGDDEHLPAIPSATISGLRTFTRRDNWSGGHMTGMPSTYVQEEEDHDYHPIHPVSDENNVSLPTATFGFFGYFILMNFRIKIQTSLFDSTCIYLYFVNIPDRKWIYSHVPLTLNWDYLAGVLL